MNFPKRDIGFEKDPTSVHLSNIRLLSSMRLKQSGSKFCVSGMEREADQKSLKLPDVSAQSFGYFGLFREVSQLNTP